METTRVLIYDLVRKLVLTDERYHDGVTAMVVATHLDMQRTNVSAALNGLVREQKLIKTKTRPVRFLLAVSDVQKPFLNLVGHLGSLQQAIKLAKAAVLYPNGPLNIHVAANSGVGSTTFVHEIQNFAWQQGIPAADGATVVIKCRDYADDSQQLDRQLFGDQADLESSCWGKAQGGIVVIDHYEYLAGPQRAKLTTALEAVKNLKRPPLIILISGLTQQVMTMPQLMVKIELPDFKERPWSERWALIRHFLTIEAQQSKRTIRVTLPAARALILATYDQNLKALKTIITMACAQAYVRFMGDTDREVRIYLADLALSVQRALAHEREYQRELTTVFESADLLMTFDIASNVDRSRFRKMPKVNQRQLDSGTHPAVVEASPSVNTQARSIKSRDTLPQSVTNVERLAKIVSPDIIKIVTAWQPDCERLLGRPLSASVFNGLCLHINGLYRHMPASEQATNESHLQQQYVVEYEAAVKLAQILATKLALTISVAEVSLLATFLVAQAPTTSRHPVVLYVMHGEGTAQALMRTTNILSQVDNTYAYDIDLAAHSKHVMQALSRKICEIDDGAGVLVIYDMGSIKWMLAAIQAKTKVKIRMIQMPVTLVGLEAARKSARVTDLDDVYHLVTLALQQLTAEKTTKDELIITLCHSGEGGAAQIKDYIDQYSRLQMRVKSLAVGTRDELVATVLRLQQVYQIHAFVGTFDPQLFGIPFIPMTMIFEHSHQQLDQVLMFQPVSGRWGAYNQIYRYFKAQLEHAEVTKLQRVLPPLMDELTTLYQLTEDQQIGLFVHLGSMIERILAGKVVAATEQTRQLLAKYPEDYQRLRQCLRPVEQTFKLIVNDEMVATLLIILKQLC
ncbi:PRD domain-containing protein [Lactiplantibacillus paraplantarum]|uniref:LuxR family transcriptional regulator n=1 Tax=Lactiplantibacillus paraplantarum TaxID=60520 RepID=A0ABQ0ND18_9LACO|nr:PRD domain-containing protein [Lactiplantibacillus paraplantarum]AVW10087.1 PRD domain-containing protein [Lactiplantibacillus paraplantarum]ERL44333.1 transcription regulator levR [Lactiplantibacillus paraplantarum]MCU4683402.1 PRD domain-containing protein [Lactiplantibacillus paraplantarum]MDL2062638.1 PRD domain-containing protein [Lactiplantibacillus paraplantarum]QJU49778.1 transcriptional regulatory protein LevR [Lactiplantibacillus paraplantarum]